MLIPVGHLGLAAGAGQAVQSGEHEILTDTGPLPPLGNVSINEGDELEPLGQAPSRSEQAELLDACLDRLTGLLLEAGEEGVGGAEVGQDDLAGLSVDALRGDDLPVAATVDDLSRERGHVLVTTTARASVSRGGIYLGIATTMGGARSRIRPGEMIGLEASI